MGGGAGSGLIGGCDRSDKQGRRGACATRAKAGERPALRGSMQIERFPRISLGHFPTPLEPMPSLERHLGGPRLYVKRDDCTGLGAGDNKVRKLEFLLADARARGADCMITI